jgi:GH18 family chitinase
VSFGGWTFSTDSSTYWIFREGVTSANRGTLAQNVANFLTSNGLDGVDFDWEYPGVSYYTSSTSHNRGPGLTRNYKAPDSIEGIPPGLVTDGPNYLKFLITLKRKLPAGMSLSIAAPASYWYLKAFPIELMSDTLDYIVYMTYDLHGQWDAGNQYSIDGCPAGNCLRSHGELTLGST